MLWNSVLELSQEEIAEDRQLCARSIDTSAPHVKRGLFRWKKKYGSQAIRKWILCTLLYMKMDSHVDILKQ